LRRAARTHSDIDVRLRAAVVADAIEKTLYGEVRKFEGHKEGVLAFALSPDGKKMVSGAWQNGTDHVARVWDLESGKELLQLKGQKGSVGGVAWSRDGKRILTASADRNVILWDADKGTLLQTLSGHLAGAWNVAFSLDGKMAVSSGSEQTLLIWDLETYKQVASNRAAADSVRSIVMRPGDKHFAAASFDGGVRLIELKTGKLVRKMVKEHKATHGAQFMAFSPDGKVLASCGGDKMVRLHDPDTGEQIAELSGHNDL